MSMVNDQLLLTVDEAAQRLSLGRTFVYGLVMRGQIASGKLGRTRRIPTVALERFVQEQLAEGDNRIEQARGPTTHS